MDCLGVVVRESGVGGVGGSLLAGRAAGRHVTSKHGSLRPSRRACQTRVPAYNRRLARVTKRAGSDNKTSVITNGVVCELVAEDELDQGFGELPKQDLSPSRSSGF